jgi:hypothetical protein
VLFTLIRCANASRECNTSHGLHLLGPPDGLEKIFLGEEVGN